MAGRAVFERLPAESGLPARRDVLRAQLPLADPASDGPVDAEALSHISAGQSPSSATWINVRGAVASDDCFKP